MVIAAVVFTACVVVVAHDVQRLSAQSFSNRASLNRTFAVLAQSVVVDERAYGREVVGLLDSGGSLSRSAFDAQVSALSVEGRQLRQRTSILLSPHIDGDVQRTLNEVTDLRVDAVDGVLGALGRSLELPTAPHTQLSASVAGAMIERSNHLWATARRSLARAPGHAHLVRSVFAVVPSSLSAQILTLTTASTLSATRAVSLSAIEVQPSPFPAARGRLVLGPTTTVSLDVVVANLRWIDQSVSVHVTVRPTGPLGVGVSRTSTVHVVALGASAVDFSSLPVVPGESASVNISLTGAPTSSSAAGRRTYQLTVAPSPST